MTSLIARSVVRRLLGVAAVAAATLGLAGCGSSAPSGAPSPSTSTSGSASTESAAYDRPSVGECRVLTKADISPHSNQTPTVPCTQDHTAITYAVIDDVPLTTLSSTSEKYLQDHVSPMCGKLMKGNVSPTPSGSGADISFAWYLPTAEELAHGARWIRCDLASYDYGQGQHKKVVAIYPLPKHGLPLFPAGAKVPDELSECWTSKAQVRCSQPHTYRLERTITVPKDAPFAGGTTSADWQARMDLCNASKPSEHPAFTGNVLGFDADLAKTDADQRKAWRTGRAFISCMSGD